MLFQISIFDLSNILILFTKWEFLGVLKLCAPSELCQPNNRTVCLVSPHLHVQCAAICLSDPFLRNTTYKIKCNLHKMFRSHFGICNRKFYGINSHLIFVCRVVRTLKQKRLDHLKIFFSIFQGKQLFSFLVTF